MSVFVVDVAYSSHDQLQAGVVEKGWHRCTVEATSPATAQLIAAQLVAATTGLPTRTRLVKEIE